MTRRNWLGYSASAVAMAAAQKTSTKDRPNILFLMTDQQRADAWGADGNRVIHTPNMDRIANEGVRFRNAYTSTPSCTPARSALLTGLSPWHHGMLGYSNIPEHFPYEKPQALRDAGYYTMSVGKQHFSPMRGGHGYHQMVLDEHCPCGNGPEAFLTAQKRAPVERCDYESWFWSQAPNADPHATGLWWNDYPAKAFTLPERLHATTWTGDTAVNFLQSYAGQSPFFMKVSFIRPHSPYDPPQRFLDQYKDAQLPEAKVGAWASRHEQRNSEKKDIWRGKLSANEIRNSRQGYYGSISHVDSQIGRILETLEKRGLLEQTLIVFTSDHGDMLGDQNLWRKSYAYQASSRIPMAMRWPAGMISAKRGITMDQPVEIRDLLPTFLDAAQAAEPPKPLDGKSLLSLVRNNGQGWREYIDLEHDVCYSRENHWNALTDGRWKYIYHARDGEEQLFDLVNDPHELKTSSDETQLRKWRGRLTSHFEERGEPFLKNGRLAPRPESMLHSPHFPGK